MLDSRAHYRVTIVIVSKFSHTEWLFFIFNERVNHENDVALPQKYLFACSFIYSCNHYTFIDNKNDVKNVQKLTVKQFAHGSLFHLSFEHFITFLLSIKSRFCIHVITSQAIANSLQWLDRK